MMHPGRALSKPPGAVQSARVPRTPRDRVVRSLRATDIFPACWDDNIRERWMLRRTPREAAHLNIGLLRFGLPRCHLRCGLGLCGRPPPDPRAAAPTAPAPCCAPTTGRSDRVLQLLDHQCPVLGLALGRPPSQARRSHRRWPSPDAYWPCV